MKDKTLAKIQIGIGIIALVIYFSGLVMSSLAAGKFAININGLVVLLFGLYALLTGKQNLK